jgi:pilus assembly protein CpaB
MKPKTLVLLAVACGCGLIAMLGVQQVMQGQQGPVKVPMVKVLKALENIDTGMRLTPDNVGFEEVPLAHAHEDAVHTEEEYLQRAAKVPLMAGDVVRKSKLTEKGEYGKSVGIPKGWRVQTIPVDDTHIIGGLLQPGDRVDVHVTYQARSDRGGTVSKTKTLLEYVEVFAADDQTESKMADKANSGKAKTVSLLVTPEQVNFILLAQTKGKLSLSWRGRSDDELAQTKDIDEQLLEELAGTVGIHDDDMFADRNNGRRDPETPNTPQPASQFLDQVNTSAPAPAAPVVAEMPSPAATWTVEIYNGNEVEPHQFEVDLMEALPEKLATPEATKETLDRAAKALESP